MPSRILLILLAACALWGQSNSGRISGTITDSSGAPMPGVAVVALNPQTSTRTATTTNESGLYVFPSIPSGTYILTAAREGFATGKLQGIVLDAASNRTADFVLSPGAVSETISVEAAAQQVEITTGEVSQTLNNRQVTEVALNGRNFMQLLRLMPGTTVGTLDPITMGLSTTGQNVNGVRTFIESTVDGMSNVDAGANISQRTTPNPDSIAEVKVLTAGYNAEYGGRAAALMNVVTRSGTAHFHGTVFEFVRNNLFDARSFFAAAPEQLHFNDLGWTIGGPIFIPQKFNAERNKLFFFWSEEWKYFHQGVTTLATVPTAAMKAGDFAGSGLAAPVDPTNGTPFPNAIVPQSRWSKNGPLLLNPYPAPNSPGSSNYVFAGSTQQDPHEATYKLDYILSDKTRFSGRGTNDYWNQLNGTASLGIVPFNFPRPGFLTSVNMTHTFSPSLMNYVSFGVGHDAYLQTPITTAISSAKLGLTIPQIYPGDSFGGVAPNLTVTGFTAYTTGGLDHKYETDIEIHDDLTKIKGNHSLKFGMMFVRSRINESPFSTDVTNGAVAFNTSALNTTKNALADVLLGNFQTYSEGYAVGLYWSRYSQYEFYAQDTWKVSRKLTLNYGLRYALHPPNYNPLGGESTFVPSLFSTANAPQIDPANGSIVARTGSPTNGLALLGDSWPSAGIGRVPAVGDSKYNSMFVGLPKGSGSTYYKNFGPRVGIAWDPFGDGKSSVRAGVGMFYDTWQQGSMLVPATNPPFNTSASVTGGNIDNPGGTVNATFPPSLGTLPLGVMKPPTVYSYNLNLQRELPGHVILDIGFVATQGHHLARQQDQNQLLPGTLTNPANKGINANALRPYRGYTTIYQQLYADNSNYNGLQITANRRVASGLALGSSFTYSKVLDTTSGGLVYNTTLGPQNTYNPKADYGLSSINRKYALSINYQWLLPTFRGGNAVARQLLGGWTMSGVMSYQSGAPNSVTVASDVAGIGVAASRASVNGQDIYLPAEQRSTSHWFNTAAFLPVAQMTAGQFGNTGRNILVGPFYSSVDLSIFKIFHLTEKVAFQFRGESFNALNHASFTTLGTTAGTTTFGAVTASTPGRIFQLGLKLLF